MDLGGKSPAIPSLRSSQLGLSRLLYLLTYFLLDRCMESLYC